MKEQMYGVVLWTDASEKKAVIWCEDHGNLAYYRASESSLHTGAGVGKGDLISFDMEEDCDIRTAQNLRRVNASYAPSLAMKLSATPLARVNKAVDNVIPFTPARRAVG